jgi:hypothetical protein
VPVCVYELRDRGDIVATGRMTLDRAPETGDVLRFGGGSARVESVAPTADGELRIALERHGSR